MVSVVSDPRQFFLLDHINRGHYMAVWRFKISLQVLKSILPVNAVNW